MSHAQQLSYELRFCRRKTIDVTPGVGNSRHDGSVATLEAWPDKRAVKKLRRWRWQKRIVVRAWNDRKFLTQMGPRRKAGKGLLRCSDVLSHRFPDCSSGASLNRR
jgi:hypothetical protein